MPLRTRPRREGVAHPTLEDHIIGIWLPVLKNDEVIAEHRSNELVMKDYAGEESVEIKITDSFGDEFKDSKRIVSSDSTK